MASSRADTRILIVDDDVGVRDTMHEYIQTVGYYAEAVSSAEEALELMGRKISTSLSRILCCLSWVAWS